MGKRGVFMNQPDPVTLKDPDIHFPRIVGRPGSMQIECSCGWTASIDYLLAALGEEFDDHMEEVRRG
jgi:hypothetical protein